MNRLQVLRLLHTQTTDAGLVYLRGLDQLVSLDLHNTRVTDDGVRELKKALPKLHIQR